MDTRVQLSNLLNTVKREFTDPLQKPEQVNNLLWNLSNNTERAALVNNENSSNALNVSRPVLLSTGGADPSARDLLATGNYDKHFTRGTDLNLNAAERKANEFNGGDNHIVVQSIFDPVVSGKNTTIDEYSVTANLPDGVDPQDLLNRMAADMDDALGGEFQELGDFKNQGDTPEVGQIIDIDVKDGPIRARQIGPVSIGGSPFNAPVVISHMDDHSFSVQTIEYNNQEHLLHGTREWGFEENSDGSVTFYTRGVSVEDIQAAEGIPGLGNAKDGEFEFWSAWADGVERELKADGAEILGKETIQTQGPSGEALWQDLSASEQHAIKTTQIQSHEREAKRLQDEADSKSFLNDVFLGDAIGLKILADEHRREAEAWEDVKVKVPEFV